MITFLEIGFAGLGAKLGHIITTKVVSETRRGNFLDCSEWSFTADQLVWKRSRSRTLSDDGTRIVLHLRSKFHRLLDAKVLKNILLEHYGALIDPFRSELYVWENVYPQGIKFHINGMELPNQSIFEPTNTRSKQEMDVHIKSSGKNSRIGRAVFVLTKEALPEENRGIVIATYGKTIKIDYLGLYPRQPEFIAGWVEAPELVECLTLNKQDFQTEGRMGQKYRRIRGELQKVFNVWLNEVGESREQEERQRVPRRLERETAQIIQRLPELKGIYAALLTMPTTTLDDNGDASGVTEEGLQLGRGQLPAKGGEGKGVPVFPGEFDGLVPREDPNGNSRIRRQPRTVRIGPQIERVSDPEITEMSWLEGDRLLINVAHPIYQMTSRRGLLGYHERFAIYYALCREASIESDEKLPLLAKALTEWSKS